MQRSSSGLSATIAWAVDREGPGKAKLPALTG